MKISLSKKVLILRLETLEWDKSQIFIFYALKDAGACDVYWAKNPSSPRCWAGEVVIFSDWYHCNLNGTKRLSRSKKLLESSQK